MDKEIKQEQKQLSHYDKEQQEMQYQFEMEQQPQNDQHQLWKSVHEKLNQSKNIEKMKTNQNTSKQQKYEYPQLQVTHNHEKHEMSDEGSTNSFLKINELKPEDKIQKKGSERSKDSSRNNSLLICIQDVQTIPPVNLQISPKGQKCIQIKIPMYRTTTFMKLQTQIFLLDVTKPGAIREYQIERRYSDFVQLYEQLFYNQPGYILAPFPDKGLESFLKIKLGLGSSQPSQRCEMIQKRMAQLERFINFVTHHPQLSNSEQLAYFITQDPLVYEQGKKRLEKYVAENRALQNKSQIKNIIGFGKSLWGTYFNKQEKQKPTQMTLGKNDIEFGVIFQTVKTQKQKLTQWYKYCLELHKAQKSFSEFVDLPTQNDILLKLCAKHTSGKQYCKKFADFLEVNVLDQYHYSIKQFQQVQKALSYRLQMWESYEQAKRQLNVQKQSKLSRRLQMFEKNFLANWENLFVSIEKNSQLIYQKFFKQWKSHKKSMRKIWKVQNNKII